MFGKIMSGAIAAGLAIMLIPSDPAAARDKRFRYQPYFGGGFFLAPRYARPRYYYDDYEPPFRQYEFEQGYYEPDVYNPPPRKLKKKKSIKTPVVTAKKNTAVAAATKPVEPPVAKPVAAAAASSKLIACDKAQSIVGGYGFEGVKASDCEGQLYAFTGTRGGKPYSIKLSSISGELTEVKKAE